MLRGHSREGNFMSVGNGFNFRNLYTTLISLIKFVENSKINRNKPIPLYTTT